MVSDDFVQDLFWIPVKSWQLTVVTLQLTGFSCLSLLLCRADVPLPCHMLSCWQLSLCFLFKFTELSYSSVQPSLFFTFLIISCDYLSFQISYKYMEVHSVPENTHSPPFLSEKLPIDCYPFFPVYNNLWTQRGHLLLPPENWQKPSLFSKQKTKYSIKNFSESQILWIVGIFMDIPNIGHLLYKELPNSSALSLEKRQLKRVMKEVCKIKSIVTRRMRSNQLVHCFLKANSWNEAQVTEPGTASSIGSVTHAVAVDVVGAKIYRLQWEAGRVYRNQRLFQS